MPDLIKNGYAEKMKKDWDRQQKKKKESQNTQQTSQSSNAYKEKLIKDWDREHNQKPKTSTPTFTSKPKQTYAETQKKNWKREEPIREARTKAAESKPEKKFDASAAAPSRKGTEYAKDEYGSNGKVRNRQTGTTKKSTSGYSPSPTYSTGEFRNATSVAKPFYVARKNEYGSDGKWRNRITESTKGSSNAVSRIAKAFKKGNSRNTRNNTK